MKNETKKRICVFCGSSMGIDPENKKISFLVGKIIGELEFDLVYGGGSNGLMGVVAKGAMSQGAKVYGIIPKFLTKIESPMDNINLTLTNTMRNRKSKMYKISSAYLILSGGIGTGNSTVAKMFVSLGSILIDADAIVHELQAPGKPVLQEIVNRFWPETLNDDGTLNRKGLGAIVFRDETARQDLGKIVHPPVRRELLARGKRALGEDAALVIVDIPLLFESGQERGDPELKIQSTILV